MITNYISNAFVSICETASKTVEFCREVKKNTLDPLGPQIYGTLLLIQGIGQFYRYFQARGEMNRHLTRIEEKNWEEDEGREPALSHAQISVEEQRQQLILTRLAVLPLPSLFWPNPGYNMWNTASQIINRTAHTRAHLSHPHISFGTAAQILANGICTIANGSLLLRQLEVVSPSNPAANTLLLLGTAVAHLQTTYNVYCFLRKIALSPITTKASRFWRAFNYLSLFSWRSAQPN